MSDAEAPQPVRPLWDPFVFARRMEARVFRAGQFNPEEMVAFLVQEALESWVEDLEVKVVRRGEWWIVSSSRDWLKGEDKYRVFHAIVRFPEGGRYAMHMEVFLTAFATDVVTAAPEGYVLFKGEDDPVLFPYVQEARKSGRMVAFRC